MKTLYAGPWVGEFGWELCWWNPVVRHYAAEYDRVIVATHESSQYLYEFAEIDKPLVQGYSRSPRNAPGRIVRCPDWRTVRRWFQ